MFVESFVYLFAIFSIIICDFLKYLIYLRCVIENNATNLIITR